MRKGRPLQWSLRAGYTLIEMLVVIAITAILIAMMLPAVQQSRETARRSRCEHNLQQLGVALHAYHGTHGRLPAGCINPVGPIRLEPQGYHHSWVVGLLPYLDEQVVADRIDPGLSIYHESQLPARQTLLTQLVCPADNIPASSSTELGSVGTSSYAGVHHHRSGAIDLNNSGTLYMNSSVAFDDIADGTAYVFLLGEVRRSRDNFGWASGTHGTLRNTGQPINALARKARQERWDAEARDAAAWEAENYGFGGVDYGGIDYGAVDDGGGYAESTIGDEGEPVIPGTIVQPPSPAVAEAFAHDPGGFGSHHTGGCHMLLADGRVKFCSESINRNVYQRMAHRADQVRVEP
ncbi:MAG: DUF1559 domain-containing protein [Planctomycetaceae bacterium]|nr:DUF1559 domain-containing protein [Planctomycetaceae bacterium]